MWILSFFSSRMFRRCHLYGVFFFPFSVRVFLRVLSPVDSEKRRRSFFRCSSPEAPLPFVIQLPPSHPHAPRNVSSKDTYDVDLPFPGSQASFSLAGFLDSHPTAWVEGLTFSIVSATSLPVNRTRHSVVPPSVCRVKFPPRPCTMMSGPFFQYLAILSRVPVFPLLPRSLRLLPLCASLFYFADDLDQDFC